MVDEISDTIEKASEIVTLSKNIKKMVALRAGLDASGAGFIYSAFEIFQSDHPLWVGLVLAGYGIGAIAGAEGLLKPQLNSALTRMREMSEDFYRE